MFIVWTAIYFFGGWNSPKVVVGPGQGPGLYLLGLLIVALYAPLYWWRRWQDRRLGGGPVEAAPALAAAGRAGAGAAPGDGAGDAGAADGPAVTEPPAGT